MARIGISITMSTSFRGVAQEFSNVFYYEDAVGSLPSSAQADGLIDEIVAFMKPWFATTVTFVRGRCWSETGNKATNQMITVRTLSGTGTIAADGNMDKERAFLFRIRAGVDSRGNPVYLRKWFHVGCWFNSSTPPTNAVLAQTGAFTTAERNTREALVATMGAIGGGTEPWKIVSKTGRNPDAGATWTCHKYLEHHQLGDAWRAA